MTKKAEIKKTPFSFKNDVLYPACTTFTAVVLGLFSLMWLVGANVTETRDKYSVKYAEDGDIDTSEWLVGEAQALSVTMLIGILLFAFSIFALSYISRLDYGKLTKRLLHFAGTEIAFFLFVILFSGYISGQTVSFGTVMVAFVIVAIFYFLILGIKTLLSRPIRFIKKHLGGIIGRYIAPVFVIFAITVIVTAFLGLFLKTNVVIHETREWDPNEAKTLYETFETVITPISHTLQNFLRYLGSAAVFMAGIAVFKTKLNTVAKWVLNFLICSCGFVLLWFIQMPFFHELDNMRLYSVIAYLAAYTVALVAVCVIKYIITRKKEKNGEYISQFSGRRGKPKTEESTLFENNDE